MRCCVCWRSLAGCVVAVGLFAAVSGCGRIVGSAGRAVGGAGAKPVSAGFKPALTPVGTKMPGSHLPEWTPVRAEGVGAAGQGGHGTFGRIGKEGSQKVLEGLMQGNDDDRKGGKPSSRPR